MIFVLTFLFSARQKKHQLDEYEKNKNNIVVTTVGWECKVVFSYPSHPATLATLHQDLAISRITEDRINADLDLAGKHDPKDTQQMQKLDAELQRAVMEARRIKGRIAYHGALDANDFTLGKLCIESRITKHLHVSLLLFCFLRYSSKI